jgi:pimeloyl-ACP methyl ester carboxylesterase
MLLRGCRFAGVNSRQNNCNDLSDPTPAADLDETEVAWFSCICAAGHPAQDRRVQQDRCWNWYRRSYQIRITGEPALLAGLTGEVLSTTPTDPARVSVAGLSAGALMALILAAVHPGIFAAAGAHSGLSVGSAHVASTAILAMKRGAPGNRSPTPMPTINSHGEDDEVCMSAADAMSPRAPPTPIRSWSAFNGRVECMKDIRLCTGHTGKEKGNSSLSYGSSPVPAMPGRAVARRGGSPIPPVPMHPERCCTSFLST